MRDGAGGIEQRAVAAEGNDDVGAVRQSLARHDGPFPSSLAAAALTALDRWRTAAGCR
jgi:hypothetical protein